MSDRERVEALAKVILDHPRFGCGCCSYGEPCPTCDAEDYDFSPHDCPRDLDREVSMARTILSSSAIRDLLAEAKADAWDEGVEEGRQRWAYQRSIVEPNPYRETTTGGTR